MTPDEIRRRRTRHDWSLQDLALHSGVNKAYLSEFENGKRRLSDEHFEKIEAAFARFDVAGTAHPELRRDGGRTRLVFVDAAGNITNEPAIAHLRWSEADGTSYTMFVGNNDD